MDRYKCLAEPKDTGENSWFSKVKMLDDFSSYQAKRLSMINSSKDEGQIFSNIKKAKHSIESISYYMRAMHSTLHRAGLWTRKFDHHEIDKLLVMNVVEPAQPAWSSPIVFLTKIDRTIRLFLQYHKLNTVASLY